MKLVETRVMNKYTILGGIGVLLAGGLLYMVVASSWRTMPPIPTVYPAHGKLVFKNGDPVRHTFMTLTPKEPGKGFACEAKTGPDGTFQLRSFSNTGPDGAVPGEYSCSLEQLPPIRGKDGAITPSVIPRKYKDTKTSGITVVIKPEDNDLGTIKLD
jgi:hypothetical protein